MRVGRFFDCAWPIRAILVLFLGAFLSVRPADAAMTPPDIIVACNSLARMAFDLKDLINVVVQLKNPGPFQDIMDEFKDISDSCLSTIGVMIRTPVITDQNDQQLIYESYSYFVQGVFELMDAITASAADLITVDKQAEFRIPAAVREMAGVTDALLYQVMAVFPTTSSYSQQAMNQMAQVDTHFRMSVHSIHLATASTGSPYSNTTTVE